ncbi:MAG: hypothetical protein ACREBE_23990, partial [bacterium]
LSAAHPEVRALVGAWLAESRLSLPKPVTLVIDVAPLDVLPSDPRPAFMQGQVAIRGGGYGEPLELQWGDRFGRASLEAGSTTARVIISEDGLARTNQLLRSFLLNVCILLFRRAGLHHVHGATLLDPRGRGWMLVGTSRSGKSTTTALLAKQGWHVGTDDIAFLCEPGARGSIEVLAWRERLALRDDVLESTGHFGGVSLGARRKTGWFPEELGTRWASCVTPTVLAFPTASETRPTSAAPLGAKDALSRLMRSSPWVALDAALADEHLRCMTQLVTQAGAWEVTLGRDLFDNPGLLLELVG